MLDMLTVLMGPREQSTRDHPWHRAERGEIPTASMQELVVPWAEAAGITLRGDEYERLLRGDYSIIDPMIDLIRELRADGHTIGLLTNSFAEFQPTLRQQLDFDLFDVFVDSSDVGHRKPEPEVYAIVTERLGVPPEQIIYLDDFHANIEGAQAAGWQTLHVTDPLAAIDDLRVMLKSLSGHPVSDLG
jgi:epoxide hydrolase-like predicted phosphatase